MEFVTDSQAIMEYIGQQIKEHMNDVLRAALPKVKARIQERVASYLTTSPEMESLISGSLRQELGVPNSEMAAQQIVQAVRESVDVEFEPIVYLGTRLTGGYTIKVLRTDFQDVLGLSEATYVTEKGVQIPWLNWLLFGGDTPLVYGYRVELNPNSFNASRSGGAIMLSSPNSWGVPTEYAGTENNNFLTRALANLPEDIDAILKEELGNA